MSAPHAPGEQEPHARARQHAFAPHAAPALAPAPAPALAPDLRPRPGTEPQPGADPDAAVRAAWVTVRAAGVASPVGGGVVVADGVVLTCAHVVNMALGRPALAAAEPTDADLAGVALHLPAAGPGEWRPVLLRWDAPRAGAKPGVWDGDLVLLRLPADAPAVAPVRLADAPLDRTAWAWAATGDGRTGVDVLVRKFLDPWLLLDPGSAQLPVRHGYSGGPLWDSAAGALVGVIVSMEPEVRRYYAIGPRAVRALLAAAGLDAAAGPPDPARAWLHSRLTGALAALPTERYARGSGQLAWLLNLPDQPRPPRQAVDAALAHPRGLAALRDSFADRFAGEADDAERELAAAVAEADPVRLLGPYDSDRLTMLLAPVELPELLAAARAAVPYVTLDARRLPDAAALLDHLENRTADPGVMPPLLKVVEEVAERRSELREALWEWTEVVARRLRVRPGALDQVRSDAAARAAGRGTGRPVVRVWLWERGRDAFTYVIRLYDGADRPLDTWAATDSPRGHEELCRELAEAVKCLVDEGENAGVEFLVEHGSFGLPFDRWPIPVPNMRPRLLGADHVVVLRGQERPARARWERRWESPDTPYPLAPVVVDLDGADDLLGENQDAALVIAGCPPREIDSMVGLCRHYGVPVVLWHRLGAAADGVESLGNLVAADWRQTLREQVRLRRLWARNDERAFGAHLALLWEDPRWDPHGATLAEPPPRNRTPRP